jgi:dienelactone hydrolase
MLAELGYTAFAADMYGNGLVFDNPGDSEKNAGVIYADMGLLKERITAAYDILVNSGFADPERIAAIGYCFGGTVVLNAASLGVPLDAVVSFHGGLAGFKADPAIKNTHVLVCNGAADKFVSQEDKDNFKNQMNAAGATYEFKEYEGALHAFTNPETTEAGRKFNMPIAYNAAADSASWNDMKEFFSKYFPVN